MEPSFSPLAEFLDDEFDGCLISADGNDPSQLYLSGFDMPDPYITLYTPAGIHLLVSTLEFGCAKKESRANTTSRLSDYDYRDNHAEHGVVVGEVKMVAVFLVDHGVDSLVAPADFPFGTVDILCEEGIAVDAETDDVFTNIHAVKADEEVERIHTVQDANEITMRAAEGFIRDVDVADDGTLTYEGEPPTSERVREGIEVTLLHHGCALDETIIACGADVADPYDRGSGPLRADEAVIIDILPRDKEMKYNGDMTRMFMKDEPSPEICEWFGFTREVFEAVLDAVEPGAIGKSIHDAACDAYEAAGESAFRADPSVETGFIHSIGRGVGLDVRELSSPSPSGGEFRPGHVITIEPGLYDSEIGGVRIEDLVIVIEDSHENLTEYPVELVVE